MKVERAKARAKILGTCFLSSSFTVCLFEVIQCALTLNQAPIVAVAMLFSVISILLSAVTAISLAAKLLSTHSVQILDLKSKTLQTPISELKKNKAAPVYTKESFEDDGDEEDIDPLFAEDEDQAERTAAKLTSQLFGGPAEKIDDSII